MGPHHRSRAGRSPGLTTWRSRHDLERARTRTWVVIAVVGLAALFFLAGLSGDNSAKIGVAILEVLLAGPLIYAAIHVRGLTRMIKQSDRLVDDDQNWLALELGRGDQALWRLQQLCDGLPAGPFRDEGKDAVVVARGLVELRSRFVRRIDQISGLDHALHGGDEHDGNTTYEGRVDQIDHQLADLAASIARLVESADSPMMRDEIQRVREATQRMAAMAEAMTELETSTPPGVSGPDDNDPPPRQ